MADTIFYKLKLKRTRTPMEVFEKMQKSIKKKGPTKKWVCTIDEGHNRMMIDFGDEKSENIVFDFENKVSEGFSKVDFPIEGELFENEKKSEFKALLNMIWSARTSFSEMEITDDYGLAEDFIESKRIKIKLRELTEEETTRVKRIYDKGITGYADLITAIMMEDMNIPENDDPMKHLNYEVNTLSFDQEPEMVCFIETYIYETAEYKDQGQLKNIPAVFYYNPSAVYFSVYAFIHGVQRICRYQSHVYRSDIINHRSFGVTDAQCLKFYNEKFIPVFEVEEDTYNKCILAYRYFLSIYDYCGFKFAGKKLPV